MSAIDQVFANKIKPLRQRKVASIRLEQKIQLLRDVLQNGLTIKDASQKNQIKLSTAKYVLKLFQTKGKIGKIYIPEVKNEEPKLKQNVNNCIIVSESEQDLYYKCLKLQDELMFQKTLNNRIEEQLFIVQQKQLQDNIQFQQQCPQIFPQQLNCNNFQQQYFNRNLVQRHFIHQ